MESVPERSGNHVYEFMLRCDRPQCEGDAVVESCFDVLYEEIRRYVEITPISRFKG